MSPKSKLPVGMCGTDCYAATDRRMTYRSKKKQRGERRERERGEDSTS